MTSLTAEELIGRTLKHYGVKGMKWGIRKNDSTGSGGPQEIKISTNKRGKVVAKGGQGHPASDDAVKTITTKQKAKKSGIQAIDNRDLQAAIQRMNMERQYKNLTQGDGVLKKTNQFVKNLLGYGQTYNEVLRFADSDAGVQLKDGLAKTRQR